MNNTVHSFHLLMNHDDVNLSIKHLNSTILLYIDKHLKEKIPPQIISSLILDKFKTSVCANAIRKHHQSNLLKSGALKPYGSAIDHVIADFSLRQDVNFIYIIHGIDSGFVTH